MANQSSNCPSPKSSQNHTNKPISSFLGSPRIFKGLLTRSLSDLENIKTSGDRLHDPESVTSPDSIIDSMQNLNIGNPFGYDGTSTNPITKNPPTFKTITKNTSQFQISRGRQDDAAFITSLNSNLDGMQNHSLGNPFGYDRKPPNPITKKPLPNKKLESESIKISRGRLYDAEVVSSPNFILDDMQNHNLENPLGYDRKPPNPTTKKPLSNNKMKSETIKTSRGRLYDAEVVTSPNSIHNKLESESIGLALIDPQRTREKSHVLFGVKLKVEIPCSIDEVQNTCVDFGEMESSEDYTCVITHGPNPRTTHIFDNCIVDSCCGVRKLIENSCKSCKDDHTTGNDIYNG